MTPNKQQVMYHVVFFDKEVSRTWVNAVCIRNFSIDDDPEDMGKVCFLVPWLKTKKTEREHKTVSQLKTDTGVC